MSEKNVVLKERMKARRSELGLKQAQLADMVGATKQSISNWENGRFVPEPDKLERIAKALSTSIEYLLGNEDAPASGGDTAHDVPHAAAEDDQHTDGGASEFPKKRAPRGAKKEAGPARERKRAAKGDVKEKRSSRAAKAEHPSKAEKRADKKEKPARAQKQAKAAKPARAPRKPKAVTAEAPIRATRRRKAVESDKGIQTPVAAPSSVEHDALNSTTTAESMFDWEHTISLGTYAWAADSARKDARIASDVQREMIINMLMQALAEFKK